MSNIQTLYVGNDTILEIENLRDEVAGVFIPDAEVTVTLKDSAGANVVGDTWPKTLTYLASSNGVYRCTMVHGLALVAGQRYSAAIVADGGNGLYASFTVDCVARARG